MENNRQENEVKTKENKVNDAKIQAIARYINRVLKQSKVVDSEDNIAVFAEEIARNYDKIMRSSRYEFKNLQSVQALLAKERRDWWSLELQLTLTMNDDSIIRDDPLKPVVIYGTPEYLSTEYQKVMAEIKKRLDRNFLIEGKRDIGYLNSRKRSIRTCIEESGITGIDIAIPQVEVNPDRINIIVDTIMERYGKKVEDKESMRARILSKLKARWAEIMSEEQYVNLEELCEDEPEISFDIPTIIYVKNDFIYLSELLETRSSCLFATPEVLRRNIAQLDERKTTLSPMDLCIDNDERKREVLERYAKEHGIELYPKVTLSGGNSVPKSIRRFPKERDER